MLPTCVLRAVLKVRVVRVVSRSRCSHHGEAGFRLLCLVLPYLVMLVIDMGACAVSACKVAALVSRAELSCGLCAGSVCARGEMLRKRVNRLLVTGVSECLNVCHRRIVSREERVRGAGEAGARSSRGWARTRRTAASRTVCGVK